MVFHCYNRATWRRIEVVITGLTRNQFAGNGTWVRIPPSPPKKEATPTGSFLFYEVGFEQFNATVRWTVARDGLTERNNDLRHRRRCKRFPSPLLNNAYTFDAYCIAAAVILTLVVLYSWIWYNQFDKLTFVKQLENFEFWRKDDKTFSKYSHKLPNFG